VATIENEGNGSPGIKIAREIARARLEILIQYPSYERDAEEGFAG